VNLSKKDYLANYCMEAIILAGGLGTRLREVVKDTPKCLASINGNPFLYYIIKSLQQNNIARFIFSLGYLSQDVLLFLETNFSGLNYCYVIEDEPLGTGGAIKLALKKANQDLVVITNADTYFNFNLNELINLHIFKKAIVSIALVEMQNYDRYGTVLMNEDGLVVEFIEKKFNEKGTINAGFYCIDKSHFIDTTTTMNTFSFEKDYIEKEVFGNKIYGFLFRGTFIDIGIPEDYYKAQLIKY
jgi:D-glycero-alpha-D-manno-heptose 1-phosphate guanylyltransferase